MVYKQIVDIIKKLCLISWLVFFIWLWNCLFSQGEEKISIIRDIFAVIRGTEEPDRYVLLGNHRDAWTYGAVDPNSGTSVLLEVARRFALLMRLGWSPRRTIILCSWDAEEFGMVGNVFFLEFSRFFLKFFYWMCTSSCNIERKLRRELHALRRTQFDTLNKFWK